MRKVVWCVLILFMLTSCASEKSVVGKISANDLREFRQRQLEEAISEWPVGLTIENMRSYEEMVKAVIESMRMRHLERYMGTYWEIETCEILEADNELYWGYEPMLDADGKTYLECYVGFVLHPVYSEVWEQYDLGAGAWAYDSETEMIYTSTSFGMKQEDDGCWSVYFVGTGRPPAPTQIID